MNDQPSPNPTYKDLRVMVVDDDEFQLAFTEELLNEIGVAEVISASSGAAALKQFNKLDPKPDLMICDLYMPGMDGFEFMAHLSKDGFEGGVLIVSGQDKRVRYSASLVAQLWSFDYLGEVEKPISKDKLESLIGKLKSVTNRSLA